jgi:hypothetical protein
VEADPPSISYLGRIAASYIGGDIAKAFRNEIAYNKKYTKAMVKRRMGGI